MKAGFVSIAIVSVGLISVQVGLAQPTQASGKVRAKQHKAVQKQQQATKQSVRGTNTEPMQEQHRDRVRQRLHDHSAVQADDAQQNRFVDGDGDGICDKQQQQTRLRSQSASQRGQYKQRSASKQASRQRASSGQTGQGFGQGFVDADGDGICDNHQRRHGQNGGQHGHGNTNQR